MDAPSFDDDGDEADMDSSCVAVSQILLSLDDAISKLPCNKQSYPPDPVVRVESILDNYGSQFTVDSASIMTLGDNRLVSDRSAAASDCERQVTSTVQMNETDACDETQYVEQCCAAGLGPVLLDRMYCAENSMTTLSADIDNSPSLLDCTQPFQFVSSDDIVQSSSMTAVMSATPSVTVAETQMQDVDVESQGAPHASSVNSASCQVQLFTGLFGFKICFLIPDMLKC